MNRDEDDQSRTDYQRLDDVFDILEDYDIAFLFDRAGSTGVRSDDLAEYKAEAARCGLPDRWVGAHVGDRDSGGAFWDSGDVLRYADRRPVREVLFSFNHEQPDLAKTLLQHLTGQGLDASWDGDPGHCVELRLGGAR
jgi:hypothetical protein